MAVFSMTPGGVDERIVREWIRRAEDDALNARSVLKHLDGTPAQACFLSQQIAEKSLKAALLYFVGEVPFTHEVSDLIDLVRPHLVLPDDVTANVEALSRYYVTARYPTEVPYESFTWERAEVAFAAAQKVSEIVQQAIKV